MCFFFSNCSIIIIPFLMAVKVKPLLYSPDVSKHEEKVNTVKMQQVSNEQTGASIVSKTNTLRHSVLLSFLFLLDLRLDNKRR